MSGDTSVGSFAAAMTPKLYQATEVFLCFIVSDLNYRRRKSCPPFYVTRRSKTHEPFRKVHILMLTREEWGSSQHLDRHVMTMLVASRRYTP